MRWAMGQWSRSQISNKPCKQHCLDHSSLMHLAYSLLLVEHTHACMPELLVLDPKQGCCWATASTGQTEAQKLTRSSLEGGAVGADARSLQSTCTRLRCAVKLFCCTRVPCRQTDAQIALLWRRCLQATIGNMHRPPNLCESNALVSPILEIMREDHFTTAVRL